MVQYIDRCTLTTELELFQYAMAGLGEPRVLKERCRLRLLGLPLGGSRLVRVELRTHHALLGTGSCYREFDEPY